MALLAPFRALSGHSTPVPFPCTFFVQFVYLYWPLSSETLRFAFLPAANSRFARSFLLDQSLSVTDKVVSCYSLHVCLSDWYLSVLVVAPPFMW